MNTILLQAAGSSGLPSTLLLVGMLAVVIIFIWLPQRKRQKESKEFREKLAKGQEVVTAGGILGKIIEIKDDIVVLEISRSTTIKIEKNSIAITADKKS